MPISYTKRGWTNNSPPAINAANLGAMDDGLKNAIDALNNMGDLDNIADGTSYKRVQAAKADAINGGTILSLNGVKFPATQSPSSDPNTLDDYEEGTWTPRLTLGGVEISTAGGAYDPKYNGGTYVKIGRKVRVKGLCYIDTKGTATGAALITGLPFTRSSNVLEVTYTYANATDITISGVLMLTILVGASGITPNAMSTSGTYTQLTDTAFTNTTNLRIDIEYFV